MAHTAILDPASTTGTGVNVTFMISVSALHPPLNVDVSKNEIVPVMVSAPLGV